MVFDKIGSFFLWLTSSKLGRYDVQNTEISVKDVARNVTADPGAYGFLDVKSGEFICELDDAKAVFLSIDPCCIGLVLALSRGWLRSSLTLMIKKP